MVMSELAAARRSGGGGAAAHVLVIPYPAQGHMLPLLDFTHHLALRGGGLTITIVVTPKNLPLLQPLLSTSSNISPLVLPFPSTHTALIPPGVENTVDLPAGGFRSMMLALSHLHDPLLQWIQRQHHSPPVAIVADMFSGWTHRLADTLNIPRYVFFPSGAFAISFVSCLWRHLPRRNSNTEDETMVVGFPEIPNSPSYPWWQLSPVYRSYVPADPDSEFIKDSFRANATCYGLVFNTFAHLEHPYLDYLKTTLGHDRVWSIGPVLPGAGPTGKRGGSSSVLESEITSWLDACPDHSVVYVCFGSQAVLTNKQMEELALGLEKSGIRFILAVKGATKGHEEGDKYGSIPKGFEGRVAGRGLVIKGWAPQVLILHHRAVCAFLTHCGWNSTLESIVAGVPMLAWPMGADQYMNATMLVDQLDVAVRVCEGPETVLGSDDLSRCLVEATGEEWADRRARAKALGKAALDAISEGGNSFNNLDDVAMHMSPQVNAM